MKEGERLRSWKGEKKTVIRNLFTICPWPLSFCLIPYTVDPMPVLSHLASRNNATLNSIPRIKSFNPQSKIQNPKSAMENPQPATRYPQPVTRNQPQTGSLNLHFNVNISPSKNVSTLYGSCLNSLIIPWF